MGEMHGVLSEIVKKRDYLEDTGTDRRIIFWGFSQWWLFWDVMLCGRT
jgi:hypothetical protein